MSIEIYTDGACRKNPGPGSWAFIVYDNDTKIFSNSGFTKHTTNNKMELTAILEALIYIYILIIFLQNLPFLVILVMLFLLLLNIWITGRRKIGKT